MVGGGLSPRHGILKRTPISSSETLPTDNEVKDLPITFRIPGQSARGDLKRPLGALQHPHGRDSRPHLQRDGFHRDHADDMETAQRPWQELETRLQGETWGIEASCSN